MLALLALSLIQRDAPAALLARMRDAVASGQESRVQALFENSEDSGYLFRMASRSGGLKTLKVDVFPAPKGWEGQGKDWAIFHTWQELEQDHDPVYQVVETPAGLKLGQEVPEWQAGGRIADVTAAAQINAAVGNAQFVAKVHVKAAQPGTTLLFRLNDTYSVLSVAEAQPGQALPAIQSTLRPMPGKVDFQRHGSLFEIVPDKADESFFVQYATTLGKGATYSDERDQITPDYAYITSFWLPSLARLPFKDHIYVMAPKDWVVRSEGVPIDPGNVMHPLLGMQVSAFNCDVPISYPKILGGKYELAGEATAGGHVLRSYQFAPVDKKRANDDLGWMQTAMKFYEENLGAFPFKEYDCFDGKNYYGIESYSYTILDPKITTWAVSHEMGHTYFGGLVPCPYVKDSWNEGVTQYVDDVLLHHNPEVEQNALAGIGVHVPLSQMPVAWEYNGATYWRGAYSMEMLDAEIGHENVLKGLRLLIADREGKETTWDDLRPYFEKASGKDLNWFWNQWITASTFPHVSIASASTRASGGKWMTHLVVKQDGTALPYRLRFRVVLLGGNGGSSTVLVTGAEQPIDVTSDFKPTRAMIVPSPTALISVDAAIPVNGG